ncbi:uncharacterized protein L201_002823 [Kwoniella dendrophila CBS 6074]|uniref:DUF7918 domain-containing protein n=1 Tax=Kwoniella dendrophila CBS 6074 TaxID=1295534 RepID=A0AAX4JSN1_9TREE
MFSEGETGGFEAWVESKDDCTRLSNYDFTVIATDCSPTKLIVSVCVIVYGELMSALLDEYQVTHHPAKGSASSYTECILEMIERPFRIVIRKTEKYDDKCDIQTDLSEDGNELAGNGWIYSPSISSLKWDSWLQYKDGQHYSSSLVFSPLLTTDNVDKITVNSECLDKLGIIEIALQRGKYGKPEIRQRKVYNKYVSGTIHEKAKKLPHSVTPGDVNPCVRKDWLWYPFRPFSDKLLHRFIFKVVSTAISINPDGNYRWVVPPCDKEEGDSNLTGILPMLDDPEESQSSTFHSLKRKCPDKEPTVGIKPEEGHNKFDTRLSFDLAHLNYLEMRIKAMENNMKRLRSGIKPPTEIIDLTSDNDEDA